MKKKSILLLVSALWLGPILFLVETPVSAIPMVSATKSYPPIPGLTDHYGDFRGQFEALTDPKIIPASQLTQLDDTEEVLGVTINGQSRAYPLRFIAWHHIVNDTLGGEPIAVTYCSVCNSGVVYNPIVDGKRRLFNVFGLYRGVMAMWDPSNSTVWSHLSGQALLGPDKGQSLSTHPVINTSWGEWKRLHPSTTTPSWDTGFQQYYGDRIVSGEHSMPSEFPATLRGLRDDRLNPFTLVEGVRIGALVRAYPYDALDAAGGVAQEMLGSHSVVVLYDSSQKTAAAFDPRIGSKTLEFSRAPIRLNAFLDTDTDSEWNVEGLCTSGKYAGTQLTRLSSEQSKWYGWSAYYPQTTVFTWPPAPRP